MNEINNDNEIILFLKKQKKSKIKKQNKTYKTLNLSAKNAFIKLINEIKESWIIEDKTNNI